MATDLPPPYGEVARKGYTAPYGESTPTKTLTLSRAGAAGIIVYTERVKNVKRYPDRLEFSGRWERGDVHLLLPFDLPDVYKYKLTEIRYKFSGAPNIELEKFFVTQWDRPLTLGGIVESCAEDEIVTFKLSNQPVLTSGFCIGLLFRDLDSNATVAESSCNPERVAKVHWYEATLELATEDDVEGLPVRMKKLPCDFIFSAHGVCSLPEHHKTGLIGATNVEHDNFRVARGRKISGKADTKIWIQCPVSLPKNKYKLIGICVVASFKSGARPLLMSAVGQQGILLEDHKLPPMRWYSDEKGYVLYHPVVAVPKHPVVAGGFTIALQVEYLQERREVVIRSYEAILRKVT